MRLINTAQTLSSGTITFENFDGSPPAYAILSHTWGNEEVTLQDALADKGIAGLEGYAKIMQTCRLAHVAHIAFAWVDTCCIDKSSSAELSEAINSMFRWYDKANAAYAYLADWQPGRGVDQEELGGCRWFSRGWTLQELIAPADLGFYDANWTLRGTKAEMNELLSHITGISRAVLRDARNRYTVLTCIKMSWAASRQTTREEDMAYSLLGIFDINMPMLYGEGTKAFVRLQETILARSRDMSLFAWRARSAEENHRGILARNPAEFTDPPEALQRASTGVPSEWSLTNYGLRMNSFLQENGAVLFLDCKAQSNESTDVGLHWLGIHLRRGVEGTYLRIRPQELAYFAPYYTLGRPSPILIETEAQVSFPPTHFDGELGKVKIVMGGRNPGFVPIYAEPSSQWDMASHSFTTTQWGTFFGCTAYVCVPSLAKTTETDLKGSTFWLLCEVYDMSLEKWGWSSLATQETLPGIEAYSKDVYPLRYQSRWRRRLEKVRVRSPHGSKVDVSIRCKERKLRHGRDITIFMDFKIVHKHEEEQH